ncbi:hypothetical protein [Lentzea albidocapillata]|uniref:DUF3800 domain-containing protein n=1 Tax=Lentzea albidocapillata TaxID=40571 RepID=A0A1W2EDL2_9PSEU|nr:hypothetical protein [Lentzea albidocapillata]SMD07482.1 hypothetical protein SAMN05660733_03894 [Lentzea albidocapillata]
MSVHAFVDESRRNDTYLLAVALVSPGQLTKLRKMLMRLRMPNQRELHFKKETPARRKQILSTLAPAVVHVDIYLACCRKGEERARQTCVARLTDDVLKVGVTRLVFDSREVRDDHDLLTIRTTLGKSSWGTGLFYEHLPSENDPLLWIPDIVAWCYGAGGDWLRRVQPLMGNVIDTRLP